MIDKKQAETMGDDLANHLHSKILDGTATAADCEALRKLLSDNNIRSMESPKGEMRKMEDEIGEVDFPVRKAE